MPSWKKQGRIFHLDEVPSRSTHTQVPTVLVKDDVVRLYYACRNNGKSFPAFVDLDRKTFEVVRVHEQPVMGLGKPGMFDSDGIMPSCVMSLGGEDSKHLWLYYIGWNAKSDGARYQNEIGLAESHDGGETFNHMYRGPIIGRSTTEPGLAVMPFVMYQNWYRMWYQSGVSWNLIDGNYEPVYVIKYAESIDGINWKRHPEQCIKPNIALEAFSRPAVILDGDTWRMWYCYRGSEDYRGGKGSYRIGYATSIDGINFERMDILAGIDVGAAGEWDSEMICYPAVVKIDDRLVMFYNGNRFGQSGIGMAFYED